MGHWGEEVGCFWMLEVGGTGLAGGSLSWGRVRKKERMVMERAHLNPALWLHGPCSYPTSKAAAAGIY